MVDDLKFDYENEISKLNNKHQKEIKGLKKQIEKFEKAFENIKIIVNSFISWVKRKLSAQSEEEIIHEFEKDTYIDFDLEKQFKIKPFKEKDYEMEL